MAGIDLFTLLGSIRVDMAGFDAAMNRVRSQTQVVEQAIQNSGQSIATASAASASQVTQNLQSTLNDIGKSATDTGKNLTKQVTLPIAAVGVASFKAAVDFESAFAGVNSCPLC